MKKILMLAACTAAMTAITSCSSNDDDVLPQATVAPAAEETVVETAKGTPFSVLPSSSTATRATRYQADAWGITNSTAWVQEFKVYGKQIGAANPWVNNVVFRRSNYDVKDWTPNRSSDYASYGAEQLAELVWPKTNTSVTPAIDSNVKTNFYAITDNAIGTGTPAAIDGITYWMIPLGSFIYSLPTDIKNISFIDATSGNGYFTDVSTTYVDDTQLKDLMVATATMKESETTSGALPLAFRHVLSGLTLKLKFLSNSFSGTEVQILSVKVVGLKTSGTYTYGAAGEHGSWNLLSGDSYIYYKEFTSKNITAEKEDDVKPNTEVEPHTINLVEAGEWLTIPQTTTPWDALYLASGATPTAGQAYVALRVYDPGTFEEIELYYPLNISLNIASNKTLTLDLGQFFEPYDKDPKDNTKAKQYYEPATMQPI